MRGNLAWWAFGIRDNGLRGYLRHFRSYERHRRRTLKLLRGMTQQQALEQVEMITGQRAPWK